MKRSLILFTLLATLLTTGALAQEICDNGKDDDNDGFIDCFDADCVGKTACNGFYVAPSGCSALPPAFPTFTMTLDFASPNETTNHIGRMAIGDMNGDGVPEIITLERFTKKLFILNGNDGTVRTSTVVNFDPIWEIAIGNIDNANGGCAEAYFAGIEGNSVYFYAFDCNLNLLWSSKIRDRDNGSNNSNALDPLNYGLADFDGDGKVELYAKDMIFDAHTGTRIINTAATNDSQWNNTNGGPVAVDMDLVPDGKLELVLGLKIYKVNLGNRSTDAGTLSLVSSVSNYFIRYPYNATSVADYNQDGALDVIASGSDRDGSNDPKRTVVFFWDVKNNVVKTFIDDNTSDYYPNGWGNGTGRINIADLDGDGKMNVSYVSGKYLYALDENFNKKWRIEINEETSGHTGCTLFDFVGDGSSEIVYRDERYLYIIDGNTGTKMATQNCISRTQREYPIVADVDADGSTEICVVCGFDDDNAWDNFNDLKYSQFSQVRVFKSASVPWVPARRLWNQHGYFNVNVNDDLTIPIKQQMHNKVFSTSSCRPSDPVRDIRPLNSFLNQSPFMNTQGCPIYSAADIAFKGNVTIKPPTCPEVDFKVSFTLTNLGSLEVSRNIPVTFYTKNPLKPGAVKLNTIQVPVNGLGLNEVVTVTDADVTGVGADSLYVVLNDAGTTVPTPIKFPNSGLVECVYDNIAKLKVIPLPAPIFATPTHFTRCGAAGTAKGSATAYVLEPNGDHNTTDFSFFWSNGGSVVSPPAFTGVTYAGRAGGQYTVIAQHKTLNCGSTSATVTINETLVNYTVTITEDHAYDNCRINNGQLKATPRDGAGNALPAGNFTYEWYKGPIAPANKVSSSQIASNLVGLPNPGQSYVVIAINKVDGCQGSSSYNLLDKREKPPVTASAAPITCSSSSTTEAIASVTGGNTGYKFEWYDGGTVQPTPDETGDTYSGLGAGQYTVVAIDNSTECESNPFTVTVVQTLPPILTANATAAMTSCDPTQPNGAVTANASSGKAPYDFKWFKGQTTTGTPVGTTASVTGLGAGVYTVLLTDDNQCTATAEVTINNNVVNPSLQLGIIGDYTNCTNANGSATVNVVPTGNAGYTFDWYQGTVIDGNPDFTEQGNQLTGLNVGKYSVVATNATTHCTTPPVTVDIKANLPTLTITNSIDQYPTKCGISDGIMTVNASASPASTNGFTFEWFKGTSPNPGTDLTVTATSYQKGNLESAIYNIKVTNRDNGCSETKAMLLPLLDAQILSLVSKIDVSTCVPGNEGQAVVKVSPSTDPALAAITFADYKVTLYKGTSSMDPEVATLFGSTDGVANGIPPADKTGNFTYTLLTPGTYTAVAYGDNVAIGNCPSEPLTFNIADLSTNPVIAALDPNPINTYCGGTTQGNAEIELDIDNGAAAANYAYVWTKRQADLISWGSIAPGSAPAPGNIAQGLIVGTYSVVVTNNATQCASTEYYAVTENPPVLSLTDADLSITDFAVCMPNPPDGAAQIMRITVNSGGTETHETDFTGYTFDWRNSANVQVGTGVSIAGQGAGTYYVTATNALNCSAESVEFEIVDKTLNSVTVSLIDFIEPTRCRRDPNDPNGNFGNLTGMLDVMPGGTLPGAYTVSWAQVGNNGTPVAPAPVPDTRLEGITINTGNTTVTFSVEVENASTNCKITDSYTLNLDMYPVVVSASAAPMTFCSNPLDGQLFASVTSPDGVINMYNYNWTDLETGQPVIPGGSTLVDVAAAKYSVVAVDIADPGCESDPEEVEVTNERTYPTVTAEAINSLSNCDPARPNGIALAMVTDGIAADYQFDWFLGTDTNVAPVVENSDQADGLTATLYTVKATDRVTGCASTVEVTVPDATAPLPASDIQVTVLSHLTTCEPVDPDGALAASVNGNVLNYDFYWYDTNPGATPDINTADFAGSEIYDSLATGTYYVSVVNRTTGCAGGPANGIIEPRPVYPEFDFVTETATCKKDDLDPGDGYISLVLTNTVSIGKVEWAAKDSPNDVLEVGPNLDDADAGTYIVTVTTEQGCATSKDVLLKTDIRPFNGISRNNDGQNDTFVIKCLDQFPDNIVRIFNRAGTLVFEAEHYNNIDIFFDGISNKGISVMGNNLPDGTYFYVIDKRDGSKPVAGYLEIVN